MRATIGFLALSLCLSLPSGARAESKEDFEERLRIEVSTVLDKFLGVGKSQVVVLVDAEPTLMLPSVRRLGEKDPKAPGEKDDNSQLLWADYSTRSRRSLMPGFVARQQMVVREDTKAPIKEASAQDRKDLPPGIEPMVLWKIKRMLISVVLDRSVDDQAAQKVGAMVMDMLGLDPDRGDKLNVYKLPFKSLWNLLLSSPSLWMQALKWVFILLLTGFAVWGLYRLWFKALDFYRKRKLEVAINPDESEELPLDDTSPLVPSPEAPQGAGFGQERTGVAQAAAPAAAKAGMLERLRAFTYVTRGNAQLLGELISRDEDIQLAAVSSFLDPALGGIVLKQLDTEKRKRVLVIMSNASHVLPDKLKQMEAEIELRLQYAIGGTEAVSDLVSQMDPPEQNEVLKALWQKDQALATKVYHMIFRFEDLLSLPERELRILVQAVPMSEWVSALTGARETAVQAFAKVLPDETRAVFQQHLEMGGGGGGGAPEAQWQIMKAAKELKAQGRIQLRKPAVASMAQPQLHPETNGVKTAGDKPAIRR